MVCCAVCVYNYPVHFFADFPPLFNAVNVVFNVVVCCMQTMCELISCRLQSPYNGSQSSLSSLEPIYNFSQTVRSDPHFPRPGSVSVASCISEWEQGVPQSRRQGSQSPPDSRNRAQGLPNSLSRRRGRCWAREVPVQPADVDLEETAHWVSGVSCCSFR